MCRNLLVVKNTLERRTAIMLSCTLTWLFGSMALQLVRKKNRKVKGCWDILFPFFSCWIWMVVQKEIKMVQCGRAEYYSTVLVPVSYVVSGSFVLSYWSTTGVVLPPGLNLRFAWVTSCKIIILGYLCQVCSGEPSTGSMIDPVSLFGLISGLPSWLKENKQLSLFSELQDLHTRKSIFPLHSICCFLCFIMSNPTTSTPPPSASSWRAAFSSAPSVVDIIASLVMVSPLLLSQHLSLHHIHILLFVELSLGSGTSCVFVITILFKPKLMQTRLRPSLFPLEAIYVATSHSHTEAFSEWLVPCFYFRIIDPLLSTLSLPLLLMGRLCLLL